MATTSADIIAVNEVACGSYRFKINHSLAAAAVARSFVVSPAFAVGGHSWSIKYFPFGSREELNGEYASVFLALESDADDVGVVFEFCVQNPDGSPSPTAWNSTAHTFPGRDDDWGFSRFIKRRELEASFLAGDGEHFAVVCTMTIVRPPEEADAPRNRAVGVPPSNLREHFGELFSSGDFADVTFDVAGEVVPAHRLVLAARSPVFRAIFYGPMAKTTTASTSPVRIDDVEPAVFRSLLHFIYTDTLPKECDEAEMSTTVMMAQHLLEAADRYGVERLKSLCQQRLRAGIRVETVATTLALAEQHGCRQLKEVCLDFAAVPENFAKVVATEGYEHLAVSCPPVVAELHEKVLAASDGDATAKRTTMPRVQRGRTPPVKRNFLSYLIPTCFKQ